jgi:hypothetical protein
VTKLRLRVAGAVVLSALALTVTAGVARADGDPASDVLVSKSAFVPWDTAAGAGQEARLEAVLGAAARRGYPIRVALIGSSTDLGSVTALWRQPENYAHYLGLELSLTVHARVLVLMPNGVGLYAAGGDLRSEQAALARVRPAGSSAALATTAITAVETLAAASGHPLPAAALLSASSPGPRSGASDPLSWIVFALGALLIALAWVASIRARPLRVRVAAEAVGADPTERRR